MDMAVRGRLFLLIDSKNMSQRVTFYIDGFNFYYGLRRTKRNEPQWGDYYWIDMVKLCESFLSCDLKDNMLHHSSKPVLMQKNERRFRDAIMPDVVTDGIKRYNCPEKWEPANFVR